MIRQANDRLQAHGESLLWSLLWLWARTKRRALTGAYRCAIGDVLLTPRVDRRRVLLSDFSDWHPVPNDIPEVRLLPGEADDEWDRRQRVVANNEENR